MACLRAPKDALYNPGDLGVPFAFHCVPVTTSALQTTPNSVVKQPPVRDAHGFCGSGIWRGRSGKDGRLLLRVGWALAGKAEVTAGS